MSSEPNDQREREFTDYILNNYISEAVFPLILLVRLQTINNETDKIQLRIMSFIFKVKIKLSEA